MKYIFFYFLACTALLSGCTKKTDEIFDKSVDERLSQTLTDYQNALTGAPGWKLFVYPKGLESQDIKVGGLTYYVKFTNTNRVSMVSDFSTDIAETPKESGYHLKALQRPSIIFDTYSYMHIPADPDPDVSGSPTGTGGNGWGTDFNFSFQDVTAKDTIYLQGNFNKSSAVLVKASQGEMDSAFNKGRLKGMMNFTREYIKANPFIYIAASPSLNVGVSFDTTLFLLSTSTPEGGLLVNKTSAFSYTTYGLHLGAPATVGNYTFQDIYWDDVKKLFYITSGATRVEFISGTQPVFPLDFVIGISYTTISVPLNPLAGSSALFGTKFNAMVSGLKTHGYNLTYAKSDFIFNDGNKTLTFNTYVTQGTNPYIIQYVYSYTKDNAGLFKFNRISANGNGANAGIEPDMRNIIDYIEQDKFKLDYYLNGTTLLGQFNSIENPTFYFTGNLF